MGNEFVSAIKYLGDCILQVVYPFKEQCLICEELTNKNNYLCDSCFNKMKFCDDKFSIVKNDKQYFYYSLAYYSNIISELILRLKYKSDFDCATVLGELMADLIVRNNICIDVITFVPATKAALRKRGYNQSKLLAKAIGRKLKLRVVASLNKNRETKDQIGLNEEMRWKNILGSYSLKNKVNLKNKEILLVDDVMTTGATTFCCAEELIKGAAKNVIILTVAKSKI